MNIAPLLKQVDIFYRQKRDSAVAVADATIHYNRYVTMVDSFRELKLSEQLHKARELIIKIILGQQYLAEELAIYFENMNDKGVPYVKFDHEPRRISQVKKFINALYYAEISFKYLEDFHIKEPSYWTALPKKVHYAVKYAYKAAHTATHLDVDLIYLFKPQLETLKPIFEMAKSYLPRQSYFEAVEFPDMQHYIEYTQRNTSAFLLGKAAGTVVSKMDPKKAVDYSWLTRISARIPEFIDDLRIKLEQITDSVVGTDSGLSEANLRRLQQEADRLLVAIQNIQLNGYLNPLNIPSYIKMIKKLLSISQAIVLECQNLNESTKDIITGKISEIKYQILPQIIILFDNIEEYLMLKPGILTQYVIPYLTSYYATVIDKLSFAIDFNEPKNLHLKELFDERFNALRQKGRRLRAHVSEKEKASIHNARQGWRQFKLALLAHKGSPLGDLDSATKKELMAHYFSFQSYVVRIDPKLDDTIVKLLNQTPSGEDYSFLAYVKWPYVFSRNLIAKLCNLDYTGAVLSLEDKLRVLFLKDENSAKFHRDLNSKISRNIDRQLSINTTSRFLLKDGQRKPQLVSAVQLPSETPEEASCPTAERIRKRKEAYDKAKDAHSQFLALIKSADKPSLVLLSQSDKSRLLAMYRLFKPFLTVDETILGPLDEQLINALEAETPDEAEEIDQALDVDAYELVSMFDDALFDTYSEVVLQCMAKSKIKEKLMQKARDVHFKEFKQRLETHGDRPVKSINERDKKTLRRLYQSFQPYLILFGGDAFASIDKHIVRMLNSQTEPPATKGSSPLTANELIILTDRFMQLGFDSAAVTLRESTRELLTLYDESIYQDRLQMPLTPLTDRRKRNHLLKAAYGSEVAKKAKEAFLKYVSLLNDAIIDSIKPADYGLPFPELEDEKDVLIVPRQVLAIKRIYNALYYCEEGLLQLESITESSFKSVYVARMLLSLGYAKNALYLLKDTSNDEFIIGMVERVQDAYSELTNAIYGNELYKRFTKEPKKSKGKSKAYLEKLKLFVEVFYTLPEDIYSLSQKTDSDINVSERDNRRARFVRESQSMTERVTDVMDNVMSDSSNWISMLLSVPEALSILKELRRRVERLTTASYDVTMSNLKEIKSDVFSRLLQLADSVEQDFVLKTGVISQPLHLMLCDFYKGLLEPLDIPDIDKLRLELDFDFLNSRGLQIGQKIAEVDFLYQEVAKPRIDAVDELFTLVNFLNSKTTAYFRRKNTVDRHKDKLIELYERLQVDLEAIDGELTATFLTDADSLTKEKVERLVKVSETLQIHMKEREATMMLDRRMWQSKSDYLEGVVQHVINDNDKRIRQYTSDKFAETITVLLEDDNRLKRVKHDYGNNLRQFLNTHQQALIDETLNKMHEVQNADIDAFLRNRLKALISLFDQQHFSNYRSLDKVSLLCQEYLSVLREDRFDIEPVHCDTWEAKVKTLNTLDAMVMDRTKSPKERLISGVVFVNQPSFRETLSQKMTFTWFSLKWLIRWFQDLFLGFREQQRIEAIEGNMHSPLYESQFFTAPPLSLGASLAVLDSSFEPALVPVLA